MSVTEITPRGDEFERTPPHDLAAEQCVLGGMLMSKDAISDVLEVIRPGDHYRPAHQLVHEVIIDLYSRGEPADPVTVANELTKRGEIARVGGAPYLHTLMACVPTAANAGYYARIVRERAILRRLVEVGTRIVQLGYSGDGDADEIVDRAEAEVYGVTDRRVSEDYRSLSEIMPGALNEIEAIGSRGGMLTGVPTGFADLDALTNGLHPGQMVVIAARPALGKSTLALDLARAASVKAGLTSVIFSLEMSRNEITMRLLSAEARVPLHSMRTGQMSEDDWARLARRMSEVVDAPMFIDDSPNMSMMEIRAKCRRLKQRHDLRLVIIDYLQLMTSPKRVENRQQEVSEMSRSLKLLAKELDVPVVAVAQLNRGPEQRSDKRPLLADLRESGCLTEDTTLLRADTGAPVTLRMLMDGDHKGALVWSIDSKQRLVPAPITRVFSSGVKDVFRLQLASGREVKASGNHPFLTLAGWVPLERLATGDRIGIPRRVPEPVGPALGWTEHRLGLLAHLIGDGCVLRSQPVHYTSNDEANLEFVERAAAAEFGITPRRVQQKTWWHTYLPAPYPCTHGRYNPLHVWFRELGIEDLRSHQKRIPQLIYSGSNREISVFLRHLWATDGCVAVPRGRTAPKAYYASSSRELADGVATLLGRLGIVARIRSVEKPGYRPSFHVIIADGPSLRAFCSEINVHGRRGEQVMELLSFLDGRAVNTNADTLPLEVWNLVKAERVRSGLTERQFQAAIGTHYCGTTLYKACPSRQRLLRCAVALGSQALRALATSDIYWDRIVAIEPMGSLPVFDASVKGTHNFVANGISAHNSIEQDSDVVILLHREDAYEPESPRAGEADFIIAKHRNGPTATVTVAFQGHYSRFVDMARL
ncbi:MAG TPA: replicative DNA helicase [Candidatus Dormibacteraeota bacterium]|nr:replicative DNA helicase [Candidatus Dormibacteraeota bacterium]